LRCDEFGDIRLGESPARSLGAVPHLDIPERAGSDMAVERFDATAEALGNLARCQQQTRRPHRVGALDGVQGADDWR
jgi:hypothetical protein